MPYSCKRKILILLLEQIEIYSEYLKEQLKNSEEYDQPIEICQQSFSEMNNCFKDFNLLIKSDELK